jgi:hypothetical protein
MPLTFLAGTVIYADSAAGFATGAQLLYQAIGAASLRPYVQGTDDVATPGWRTRPCRAPEPGDVYCFVTSNHRDFSLPNGDRRQPHPDLADLFASTQSRYCYGVDGLNDVLAEHLGNDFLEEQEEVDFLINAEEPRTLEEIVRAEQEFFDRVWYVRRVVHSETADVSYPDRGAKYGRDELWKPIGEGHDKAWEYGYISGKLAALRWVLGSEWDFLDL